MCLLKRDFAIIVPLCLNFCNFFQDSTTSAQNGEKSPSNTEKTNNFVQQPISSTLLSSSAASSSTIESVDGKSVASRSRLNSYGKGC